MPVATCVRAVRSPEATMPVATLREGCEIAGCHDAGAMPGGNLQRPIPDPTVDLPRCISQRLSAHARG